MSPYTPYNSWALESPRNWRASRNQELAVLWFTQGIAPFHRVTKRRRTMAYAYLEEHFCSWEIIMIIALAFVSTSSQSCALSGTGNMNGSSQPPIEHLRKAQEYIFVNTSFIFVNHSALNLWNLSLASWFVSPTNASAFRGDVFHLFGWRSRHTRLPAHPFRAQLGISDLVADCDWQVR